MKLFSHGILGMNARNLRYIREKNSKDSLSLADSKLKTKNFLSARGIPFAATYATIDSSQELSHFSFESLGMNSFVIKPNQGSKGQGIIVIKKKKGKKYVGVDREWTEDELKLHMADILAGAFSISGGHDRVMIEELLLPGRDFSRYCRHGLADIRVIVYNYVPITAMVRMPTERSEGKANLAQGGIGLGLNISNGEVVTFSADKETHLHFPESYGFLKGSYVPHWDSILLYSAEVQAYTNLGYLALDWVVTKNGPRLLEINARAGLEIQNVNFVPLAKRLDQVASLKIPSPEKGVEIAKTLFHTEVSTESFGKKILDFHQQAKIGNLDIVLEVDIAREKSAASPDIHKKFKETATCVLSDNTRLLVHLDDVLEGVGKSRVVLGQNDLTNCLLRPGSAKKSEQISEKYDPLIHDIDYRVHELSRKLNLSSLFRPLNYQEELDRFLESPFNYNPIFRYPFPNDEKIASLRDQILGIRESIAALSGKYRSFALLFSEKLDEIADRISLIEALKNEDHEGIQTANRKLFGFFDQKLLDLASKKVLDISRIDEQKTQKVLGKILSIDEIEDRLKNHLKQQGMEEVPINISSKTLSRMAIAYKKSSVQINISPNAVIREKELDAIFAHEIDVHLRRYLNGQKSGLKIFSAGTGHYIVDEEGFAIYNSLMLLPE